MASVEKISNGSGTAWRARYRTPDGKSREKRFARKVDAEQFLTSVEHRKLTGEYIDSSAGRITFDAYADGWLDRKRATTKRTSSGTQESHLRKHLRPAFGAMELRTITREHVKSFATILAGEVAPTTARQIVFTLAAVLREAVDDGRIVRNPADRVRIGSKTERRVDPMHIGRVAARVPALADAMPSRWRAAVLLMAATGLRLGECLGLTVDRVDFLRRTIRVDRQLANVAGQRGFGSPKTRAGVRTIPVTIDVVNLLAAHLGSFPAGDDGLIFTAAANRQGGRIGAPVRRSAWSDAYRAACKGADLPGDRTRTHDLRHVAASSLIAHGLSVSAVQAVLGHSSPAETLEVYTHLWPSDEDRTREAMERATSDWLKEAL